MAARPQRSCVSTGRPSARASTTAAKPFAPSSTPPATPWSGVTAFARFEPPSLRDPYARRSMPFARAIQYGNEIEARMYETRTAIASITRLEYGRGRLRLLQDLVEDNSVFDRLRDGGRRRVQGPDAPRASPCPRHSSGSCREAIRTGGRSARGKTSSGRADRGEERGTRRQLPGGGEQR